jgi:hypothetical protein
MWNFFGFRVMTKYLKFGKAASAYSYLEEI